MKQMTTREAKNKAWVESMSPKDRKDQTKVSLDELAAAKRILARGWPGKEMMKVSRSWVELHRSLLSMMGYRKDTRIRWPKAPREATA